MEAHASPMAATPTHVIDHPASLAPTASQRSLLAQTTLALTAVFAS